MVVCCTDQWHLKCQWQQKSSAFLVCQNVSEASMEDSVNPDQTAPIGAVCSASSLFASILKFASYVGQLFAADFSRQHFQMHFFRGPLRVKMIAHLPVIRFLRIRPCI